MKTKLTTLLCLLVMCLFVVASLAGCQGANGTDGKSAYQLWLDQGNTGTVQDFVNSLKGPAGNDGKGIASVERNANGELVLTYTDGTSVNLGKVVFEDPSVKCDHDFAQYEMTAATCTEGGHILNVCTKDCGYAYITYTETDPDNHSGLDVEHLDPTCTEEGYDKAICTGCNWADEPVAIAPLGHDYNEGLSVIVVAPTCEKDGCITATCQRCGDVEVEVASVANGLLATGHDTTGVWVTVVDEGANICVDGGQRLYVCATCFTSCTNCAGKILDAQAIAPEGHNITADWTVTTAPTFETTGVLAGFCDVCGTNATYELPKLGAAYTKTSPVIPTCTTEGVDNYAITVKGWSGSFDVTTTTVHVYNGVEMPLDKVYAPSEVGRVYGNAPATCLDNSGKGSFVCDICGIDYLVSVKGECEYTEDDVIEFVDSTCSTTGHKTYKCPTCGEEYTETIALKAHTYTGAPTVTGPTNGVITLTFKCDVCNAPKVIECTNYTVTENPASCAAPGTTVYEYTYTDPNGQPQTDSFTVTHEQLAHYYTNASGNVEIDLTKVYTMSELKTIFGEALTDLTTYGNVYTDCTTSGKVSFICSGCGEAFLFDATGDHVYVETSRTPATCTAAGTITYTCSKDATHTKTVTDPAAPATGHTYVLDEDATDVANNKFVFVCENDATHVLNIEAETYRTVTTPADCMNGGNKTLYYTYIDPNTGLETAEQSVVLETYQPTGKHTHGTTTDIDLDKVYTIAQLKAIFGDNLDGITIYGNYPTVCTDEVPVSFVCDVCNEPLLINKVVGEHVYTEWNVVPETCVTDGYKDRNCSVCHQAYDKVAGNPATGHSFTYELTLEPTAEAAGTVVAECANCTDYNKEYTIPAKGSEEYTQVTTRPATCQAEGLYTYTYVVMDGETTIYTYSYTETIPVVEHVDAVPPVETTWELDGYLYTGYFCGECRQMIVTNKVAIED